MEVEAGVTKDSEPAEMVADELVLAAVKEVMVKVEVD